METRYNNLGFETPNFVLNAGTLFFLNIFWCVMVMVCLSLALVKKVKIITRLVTWMKSKLFFTFIIRSTIESYVELFLSGMLTLKYGLKWETSGDYFGSILSIFYSISLLFLPIFYTFSVIKFKTKLIEGNWTEKYGDAYMQLQTQLTPALLYNFYFMIRRILWVLSILYLDFSIAI
jgi:hypothetical protein